MLRKRSLELHAPQWGYVVRVPEGNSTILNYTGLNNEDDYLSLELSLYIGKPGNLLLVPDSTINLPFISSADTNNPIVSTYSILAEDLDAITPKSACNYKLRIEESRTDAVAYSEYFAVIKANDNGINATTLCPDPEGSLAPFSDLYSVSDSTHPLNTGGSEGITTTILAIAVVATFLSVVVIVSSFLLIARKRYWWPFNRTSVQPARKEMTQGTDSCQNCNVVARTELGTIGHNKPVHEISGNEIMSDSLVR